MAVCDGCGNDYDQALRDRHLPSSPVAGTPQRRRRVGGVRLLEHGFAA
jgi:hypothetical protein